MLCIPHTHGWLCPAVHAGSRKWVLPPEQRLSSAGGTEQQFLRLPHDWMLFCLPCPWLCPCWGPFCSTPIPRLSVEGGSGHSCPQAGLAPMEQALLGPPSVQQSPTSLFSFHREQPCPKISVKKILRIILSCKIFSKFAKTPPKTISG